MNLFVFSEDFNNIKDRNKRCIYIFKSGTQKATTYSYTEAT